MNVRIVLDLDDKHVAFSDLKKIREAVAMLTISTSGRVKSGTIEFQEAGEFVTEIVVPEGTVADE
jgi:hypothetical protein